MVDPFVALFRGRPPVSGRSADDGSQQLRELQTAAYHVVVIWSILAQTSSTE
jgi:hypothetical protein